jgi:parvulin-like peptidyl-prolyl isomerase
MISLALLLAALAASSPDDVLATYRGGTVTRADYESWLLAYGLKHEDEQRAARLEGVALSESLEAAAMAARLDQEPHTAFRLARIEEGLLAAALRQEVDRAIVIADEAVEAALKAEDKERYKPRTVRLRNIFKKVPHGATDAARAATRERMEEIRRQLLAGADFDDLAWRESESQTRFRGGAMGYIPPGVLRPDLERIAFALKKGELSPVLASADGLTILRCDDIDEGRVIPLDEARTMIRQGLWSRASLARQAELRTDLLTEAAPRYADTAGGDDSAAVSFQGGRITEAELRWLAGGPGPVPAESRRSLLEEQVVRVMSARRARARGLDQDALLRARVRWQRARLLATDEIARRINQSLVAPTDEEMRAHYRQNSQRYLSPVRVDVALIRWPLDKARMRQQFGEAEATVARLRAGELAFDQAARETSAHPSAAKGGRLGLLAMNDLAVLGPNVFRTVEELAPGHISGVVQQDDAIYVVKLWERQASRPLAFEEAAALVEKELGDARVAALQKEREAEARRALGFALSPATSPATGS